MSQTRKKIASAFRAISVTRGTLSSVINVPSGTALLVLASRLPSLKTFKTRTTYAESASDVIFILIMLDKFTFLRFEAQA